MTRPLLAAAAALWWAASPAAAQGGAPPGPGTPPPGWPTLGGGPRRSGQASVAGPTTGTLAWTAARPQPTFSWELYVGAPTVAADGTVVAGATTGWFAFAGATGAQLWNATAAGGATRATATHGADGGVFLSTGQRVYSLALATGAQRWSADLGATVSPCPAVTGDNTVVVAAGAQAVALNGTTGVQRWAVPLGGASVVCSPAIGGGAAGGGVVYVGTSGGAGGGAGTGGGSLLALSAATGATLWSAPLTGAPADPCAPAVGPDGSVVLGTSDYKVRAPRV
jgi:outer membrane protein assembly factor BamB